MNDLVDISHLQARLGITLTSPEATRAQMLLDMAAGLVRGHCKQHITKVTNDVYTVPGNWSDIILLPERPVIDVSYVSATFYDGTPYVFAQPTYFVDRDELVRYPFPIGLIRHFFTTGNGWLGPGYTISVTYTHGFDPDASVIPYPLLVAQSVALDSVIRAWTNPASLAQSSIGGVLESYPPGNGMLLTAEEKWNLNDVFRRNTQSIRLR